MIYNFFFYMKINQNIKKKTIKQKNINFLNKKIKILLKKYNNF